MSSARRNRRVERTLRLGGPAVLNIVSLIDVFAILVFYLLVNSLTVEVLPVPPSLQLAESEARLLPKPTLAVTVTDRDIFVGGHRVMTTAQAVTAAPQPFEALKVALRAAGSGQPVTGEINIVADKRIPFRVLQQVMSACSDAQYAHISLAVVEKPEGHGA